MEGPRPPLESEYPLLIDFLNLKLRGNCQWSIEDEYPTALNPSNRNNSRVIIINDKVISHAVVKPYVVKTPQLVVKVAAIGSVVTDENFRGHGYSTKVIEDCIELSKKQDCILAILWTDIFDFYRRLGFELVGNEIKIEITKPLLNLGNTTFKVIKGPQIDPQLLLNLYNKHTVTSYRTVIDIQKLIRIPNSNIYTSWNDEGKMVAYAIEGKGEDLKGYIHEWGGDVNPLMNLFNFIYETGGKNNLNIISPSHSQNLIQKMKQAGATCSSGYLGMIKILNYDLFFKKIKKAAKIYGINDLIFEKSETNFKVGVGANVYHLSSEEIILKLIFGPQKSSEIFNFDSETIKAFQQVFPIKFWLWGWDSI